MININPSAKHPLLDHCQTIYEYSSFIQTIRNYLDLEYERTNAITAAMNDCLDKGIMVDFIHEHGSEVINMLFTEFNMEDALEVRGEERYADGLSDGIAEGREEGLLKSKTDDILSFLSDLGSVSDDLKKTILLQRDLTTLSLWVKAAARASSVEDFAQKILK